MNEEDISEYDQLADNEVEEDLPSIGSTLADRVKRARRTSVTTNGHGSKQPVIKHEPSSHESDASSPSDQSEEEEEESDNQPGPSSRLLAPKQEVPTRASLRRVKKEVVSDVDEEEEYEEEDEEEDEDDEVPEDEEEDGDEYKPTGSRNVGTKRRVTNSRRRPKRRDSSDYDEELSPPRRHSDRVVKVANSFFISVVNNRTTRQDG